MLKGRAALAGMAVVLCLLALTYSTWSEDSSDDASGLLSDAAKKRLKQAVEKAGKAPSSSERAKIQRLIMPIANHLATRLLYTEVAERARSNPKAPGHAAMEHVLNSNKELDEIEASVKNKLINLHSGAWAQEVYRKTPVKYHKLLPALATQAAHTSTLEAFNHLKKQMIMAEKKPTFMKHLKPTDPNA